MGQVLSRRLSIIVLLVIVLLPMSVAANYNQLNVVFVNTDRGSFTTATIDEYTQYIDDALAFWDIAPAVSISTQYIARAHTGVEWVDLYKETPTLYIVYTNGTALASGSHGSAHYEFKFAVVSSASPWPAATIAHEFGHLLFGLPDLYLDGPCNTTDIMCNHVQAYLLNKIGCQSLDTLGKPCMFVSLPLIHD